MVLAVALRGSDDPREFDPAPAACIERWNSDQAALALGRHQSGAHGYYEVQVLTLSADGNALVSQGPRAPAAPWSSPLARSIPSRSLPPRSRGEGLDPLSRLTSFNRLATLQSEAQSAYNARIGPDGRIEAL